MESTQEGDSVSMSDEELFKKIEDYPWDSDEEFQSGLRAILGPDPNLDQEKPLTLRARCFYYSRQATDFAVDRGIQLIASVGNVMYRSTLMPTKSGIPGKDSMRIHW